VADEVGRLGVGGTGEEQLVVDLDAARLLRRGEQVELVTRDAAAAERSDDLAGRDGLVGDGRMPTGMCHGSCVGGEVAHGHSSILAVVSHVVYSLIRQPG
jgi:hypothetical protein